MAAEQFILGTQAVQTMGEEFTVNAMLDQLLPMNGSNLTQEELLGNENIIRARNLPESEIPNFLTRLTDGYLNAETDMEQLLGRWVLPADLAFFATLTVPGIYSEKSLYSEGKQVVTEAISTINQWVDNFDGYQRILATLGAGYADVVVAVMGIITIGGIAALSAVTVGSIVHQATEVIRRARRHEDVAKFMDSESIGRHPNPYLLKYSEDLY